jgi:hypothetical protein
MASKKNRSIPESSGDSKKSQELLLYLLDAVDKVDLIDPSEIPDISLYMDQVTTYMDEHLKQSRRRDEDKILTKTMINNYAKNKLLPPPEKKKYAKEHIMLLILIYYFKGTLSLQDIQAVMEPICERYFHADSDRGIDDLYEEIVRMNRDRQKGFREDVNDMVDTAADYFSDAKDEEREFLRVLAMINMLSYDVFVRRMLIEKLIDRYFNEDQNEKSTSKKKG